MIEGSICEAIYRVLGDRKPLPIVAVPQRSGIYFLLWKGEVVYVGQSVHVDWRVATHYGERIKRFDSAVFLPFRESELNYYEDLFIRSLKPKYNTGYRTSGPLLDPPQQTECECAGLAVGFLTHTDEDGIVFDDLFGRLRSNGVMVSRPAIVRLLDADPRLSFSANDMKYRLSKSTPCT